jgi:hypothetical protein
MMTDFFHATRIFAFIDPGRASESVANLFARFMSSKRLISRKERRVRAVMYKVRVSKTCLCLSAVSVLVIIVRHKLTNPV